MKRVQGMIAKLTNSKAFQWMNRYKILQLLVPAAVIAFVYAQGRKEFRRIDWGATLQLIRDMKPSVLLFLFAFSLLSVAVIGGYDLIIRKHFRFPIPAWAAFRYGWIANTSNSVIGFAGIAGAGLRTILYRKWGIPMPTIAASVAFLSTITITGLSLMAWAGLFGFLPMDAVLRAHPWIRYVVWADALYLPAFILLQRSRLVSQWFNRDKGRMDWGTISSSVGVSLLEWVMAGLTFWLIARLLLPELTAAQGLGIYTVSAVTGLVSMAPGGIGGFDLTALLGLGLLGHDPGKAAAVLVMFRLLYYLAPWVIGLVAAAFEFTLMNRKEPAEANVQNLENVLNPWQRLWNGPAPFRTGGKIGSWSLSKLVFAAGFLLLLFAAVPHLLTRLRIGGDLLSAPLLLLSHQLSVVIGLLLIVLSWGITHRVQRAYWWTLSLLTAGSLFAFTNPFDYGESIVLLGICLLLWVSRRHFYRETSPYEAQNAAHWGFITLVCVFVFFLIGIGTRPGTLMDMASARFANPGGDTVAVMAAASLAILAVPLLRMARRAGTGRSLYRALEGRVLIPYTRDKDRLVVIGRPEGDRALIVEALEDFRRFAHRQALTVEFGQFGEIGEEP
ncbi:lysylphosphatidylglycerol synthase domain-containing protein [Cohnella sp. CFH 77786]|uniref:lysylphosphatidylglycerol synthase domain-containing protein n=1 Tax=Cohnella sp. CFH 77786 TaxID=2662265 RepID=UPI001C6111D4|nr:lysylphosphatidylglycerol synthase domain-containing protein [Cohnella sp. CFH 77786]